MARLYTEADYENSVIELFRNMGYSYLYGPDIERDFRNPLYEEELVASLYRLNRSLPEDAISDALFKLKNFENGELVQKNAAFMDYLQNGIPVRYFEKGEERSSIVYLVDYKNPDNNSFIVANQWTFIENSNKRPDILLFLNGIPVVIVELKSPSREETDASAAYRQLRNYMKEIPSMFIYNAICVMSDQMTSKAGTITSGEDRFMEWKTVDGSYENTQYAQFDTFFEGMFQKERLLDLIKNFICFSNEGVNSFKILAGYHQYFAVRKAIESTKRATVTDGKGGVFWHTQGSGKSLSMVFYAHLLQEALDSPTIVVLTDRNDLDDQLFGQFAKCKDFLRQDPMHAQSRENLRDLLAGRQANGIIFTTMQKFEESHEALSERRNIIVMADEAHRGQYGLTEKIKMTKNEDGEEIAKRVVGTARIIRNSLPNATYIGFTGTPISSKDRSTREVFGDYIDIYDMTQAVEDGATRPVYYESRVIKLNLDEATLHMIDTEYEIMAHNADPEVIEKSKKTLGQMEAVLGNDNTINSLVNDILDHYENYREGLLTGKAMIVAYSRPIAMKIYKRILELRPDWTEKVGIVMTSGNNDPEEWHDIIGNKRHKDELAKKFKDNNSPMKIAIVVDMWLTGFDVPSLATMYVYKPMSGYNLMQAIARVNRVFRDKEGGLVVDYVGIATALKQAMNDYTTRDKKNYGDTDVAKVAYPKFIEKLGICRDMFHGFDMDRTMLRIGAMNMMTHGVDNPKIEYRDSLSDQNPDKDKYSLILANPPFKGSLDYEIVSADLLKVCKTKKTELLFVALFLRMLKVGGRCACIVPDGVLFGSSNAHKSIRKELVENNRLEAVISMPSGVFKPYAGVSTAILIFTKTGHGGTDKVWFYDMKADGLSLDDKRSEIKENDIPDIIARFRNLEAEADRERTEQSFFVPKEEIVENAYDLSINKYKKVEYVPIEYPSTQEIMTDLHEIEMKIGEEMAALEELLGL